ncbi:hypothetical protein [uncultured Roseovarius sp.]|uniref:hypothetical protein n=1 Tax=uncultured Roseovarius sp. TaxID=293344 RepID=UPI00262AE285|nr:hypothetical protein [uncultured Roseovarius sp.]
MKKPLHPVTDHAVIRYLERVKGVDIEALRREIGRVADAGIEAGATGVISGGFVYRIETGVVITVLHHNRAERGKPRRRRRGA